MNGLYNDSELKLIPYGLGSFKKLRGRDYAYVDKTRFIQKLELEASPYPFFIRPRRFGKTLFANMLMAYYDKAAQPDFERNFAGTWIYDHPTPLAGKYLVVKFDFSGIEPGGELVRNFISSVKRSLMDFRKRYLSDDPAMRRLLSEPTESLARLLTDFLAVVNGELNNKVYIIIDEYDQFALNLLASDPETFRSITGKEGFLRAFYAVLKNSEDIVDRIFITGVTSLSLDSMTSGFNLAKNISNSARYAGMLGFTDEELRKLIPQIVDVEGCGHDADDIFARMKVLYDGYRFSPESGETVFNSSMCLYYLQALAENHSEPRILLDPAFSMDLSKIEGILSLGDRQFADKVVENILLDRDVLVNPINVINFNASLTLSDDDVLMALVFMGFLTFGESPGHLKCPNLAVKEVFFKYWFRRFGKRNDLSFPIMPLQETVASLEAGDARPLLDFVSDRLQKCVGGHVHAHLNETAIQLAVCMAMNTVPGWSVTVEEDALGEGFTDLVLRPGASRPGVPAWLMEFKYLKKSAFTQAAAAAKLSEAKAQLERYSASDNLAALPDLRRAAVLFCGTELVALEVF